MNKLRDTVNKLRDTVNKLRDTVKKSSPLISIGKGVEHRTVSLSGVNSPVKMDIPALVQVRDQTNKQKCIKI